MKYLFFIGLMCVCFGFVIKPIEKPGKQIFLLMGQSNMAGRGVLDTETKAINKDIFMLDKSGNWVIAKDPLHFDKPSAGVGPGLSFAQTMLSENKNIQIGLIPCAWGGSPIKVWSPGAKYFDNFPYDEAIARAKTAMQKGVLKGILWHQGESDNSPEKASVYLEKLKQLISNLRRDLDQPNLPFVAGEIGYFNKSDNINSVINKLPEEVKNTAVVSAKDLKDKGDHLHFDAASARELGVRYAAAMKKLKSEILDKTEKPSVVLTFDDAEISHYNNVAPLLLKYGFNATFFVCEFPLHNQEEKKEYMSWNQIYELHKMGFEIGNHTGHHRNVTKLKPNEIEDELQYIEAKCKEYNIPKPVSFAYPGNRNHSISQSILKQRGYKYARAGGSALYNTDKDLPLAIPSYTVTDSDKIKNRVMSALKSLEPNQILVLTFHGVPDIVHPDYSTSTEFLSEILQLLKDRQYNVLAMKDL